MNFCKLYKQYRDNWWGLPLILPCLVLPIIKLTTTYIYIDGGKTYLYYLPLAFMLGMMLFFGMKALPGLILGITVCMTWGMHPIEKIGLTLQFLLPTIVAAGGYHLFSYRRKMVSHGDMRLVMHRVFWQVFVPTTLFFVLIQFPLYLGLYPNMSATRWVTPFTQRNLINYQAFLMGYLTGVPICYLLIRLIRHPSYIRSLISQMRRDFDPNVTIKEMVVWSGMLMGIFSMMLIPLNKDSTIFGTNYSLALLLPVMLWGAMRFGYRCISLIWTLVLIIAIHFHRHYLLPNHDYSMRLAILSANYLVFSFVIVYIAVLSGRQRAIHQRAQCISFIDPLASLPNIRALTRDINSTPWSVLCFLRIPDLDVLTRHYGIMPQVYYKQNLAVFLNNDLHPGESLYQLTCTDMALLVSTDSYQERINVLYERIKQFRYIWNGMPLQPQIGMSYCYTHSPIEHVSLMLGELCTTAELSLATHRPENLQRRRAQYLQKEVKDKIAMMVRVHQALENDRFYLLAQPIMGVRGDDYHEVLLRMLDDDNELISPMAFLPIAHEFGLASRIDLWVLEHTLRFMVKGREHCPGMRLAVNISPSTVSGAHFPQQVEKLLLEYGIEAWQLIFEVTESDSLAYPEQAHRTLKDLQSLGCRVAIDDFGTGYASYARLKHVSADILKIDGSFIRHIATSSLDYQIVSSICHLARMKKMRVVAEYVEDEAIRSTALSLGIDYLQGDSIGKPAPLEELVTVLGERVKSEGGVAGQRFLSDF